MIWRGKEGAHMRIHMSKRSDVYELVIFFQEALISHISLITHGIRAALTCSEQTNESNRIFQYIEEVLPGGLLHASIAIGAHSQPGAAKADGWQRTTPTCYLVSDLGLIAKWTKVAVGLHGLHAVFVSINAEE